MNSTYYIIKVPIYKIYILNNIIKNVPIIEIFVYIQFALRKKVALYTIQK